MLDDSVETAHWNNPGVVLDTARDGGITIHTRLCCIILHMYEYIVTCVWEHCTCECVGSSNSGATGLWHCEYSIKLVMLKFLSGWWNGTDGFPRVFLLCYDADYVTFSDGIIVELERIWKEVIISSFRYYHNIFLEGLMETRKNLNQDSCVLAEIWIKHSIRYHMLSSVDLKVNVSSATSVSFTRLSEKRIFRVVSLQHSVAGEVCSDCLDVWGTDCIEMGLGTK